MGPWRKYRLYKKWKGAQHLHSYEHATGLTPSLSCDAVGHYMQIDDYKEVFDQDVCRKFCIAIGQDW